MKKTTSLTIIIIILSLVIVGGGVAFYLTNKKQTNNRVLNDNSANSITDEVYTDKDFSIKPPEKWQKVSMPNTLVAFRNPNESFPKNSPAARINFNSYIAVSFDNTQQRTFSEFVEFIKQKTKELVPSVVYTEQVEKQINGQPAKFIELEMTQQDINFKVLMVSVNAQDKYYLISCNTTIGKWDQYKELFYSTAESFKLSSE